MITPLYREVYHMGEQVIVRCPECGGIRRGGGVWAEATERCICRSRKAQELPPDLANGGHLAHPWSFAELVGRGDK